MLTVQVKKIDNTEKEKLVAKLEAKRKTPFRETEVACVNRSPYVIREVDINKVVKRRKHVLEICVKRRREILFTTINDVNITKKGFRSLKPDTEVYNNIIDGLVEVLNFQERLRSNSSPYRLFLHTKIVVDWMLNNMESSEDKRYNKFKSNIQGALRNNIELLDLKPLDMGTALKQLGCMMKMVNRICVIDNFDDSVPLVGLRNHEDYFQKDSPYKLKHLFVKYLKECNHPKTNEITSSVIKKVKISCSTRSNVVDCAIFVMRHMEKYIGVHEPFNTGLSNHGMKKKGQLNNHRRKYLYHILYSDVNLLKEDVRANAQKK
ncbi:hypothetical protein R6Q57_024282 [Mikania cordata]